MALAEWTLLQALRAPSSGTARSRITKLRETELMEVVSAATLAVKQNDGSGRGALCKTTEVHTYALCVYARLFFMFMCPEWPVGVTYFFTSTNLKLAIRKTGNVFILMHKYLFAACERTNFVVKNVSCVKLSLGDLRFAITIEMKFYL